MKFAWSWLRFGCIAGSEESGVGKGNGPCSAKTALCGWKNVS